MTVQEYIIEFEQLYHKLKSTQHRTSRWCTRLLFLASANISDHHKQLVRATLPELSHQKMKEQLLKVINDTSVFSSDADIKNESSIKVEPTFQSRVFQEHSYYAQSNPRFMNSFRARGRGARGTPQNKGKKSKS